MHIYVSLVSFVLKCLESLFEHIFGILRNLLLLSFEVFASYAWEPAPAALHRHWASGHTSELATRNCNFLILIPAAAQCRAAANYGNICAAPGNSLCLHSNSLRPSVAIAMHWN